MPTDISAAALARRFGAPVAVAAALLLRSTCAGAAPYVPGTPEADPPTGATGRPEVEQALPSDAGKALGTGIRWELGPIRYAGTVSLDGRWLRLDSGSQSLQGLAYHDIDVATYVWQPWFLQLRGGIGVQVARDSSSGPGSPATTTNSGGLTGRFSMALFPVSRFPFELRADVSDSRVRGDTIGSDYRSHRFSVSQAYRPETGNDSYSAAFDYSRLRPGEGGQDTLTSLRGTATRQFDQHSFELTGLLSRNDRNDTDARSRIASLSARHAYNPSSSLHVDTLATWNDLRLQSGDAANRFDSASDIRQISSFATWRPIEGQWLYSATSPLYLTGSMRLVDSGGNSGGVDQRARAINASLGASKELTREIRLAGSLSATQVNSGGNASSTITSANASVGYTPEGSLILGWRYSPSAGANVGVSGSSGSGVRHTLSGQVAHGVSRSFAFRESDSLSLNLSQSLGAGRDSQSQVLSRDLSHSAALFWQGGGGGSSQSYGGLSFSDSRNWAQQSGSFQLANLQFSRRSQLSRNASWSGNLTLQASRSDTTLADDPLTPFTVVPRPASAGWQRFYSGSLSYENYRVLDVPRLRFTALLSVNSQQLESRALGDFDAPRERIGLSIENRLDYSIGRLEARLSARVAQVDGRKVASVFVRVQRRY